MAEPPSTPPPDEGDDDGADDDGARLPTTRAEVISLDDLAERAADVLRNNKGQPMTLMAALLQAGFGDLNDRTLALQILKSRLRPNGRDYDLTQRKRWYREGRGQSWAEKLVDASPDKTKLIGMRPRIASVEQARGKIEVLDVGARTKALAQDALDAIAHNNGRKQGKVETEDMAEAVVKALAAAATQRSDDAAEAKVREAELKAEAAEQRAAMAERLSVRAIEGANAMIAAALATKSGETAP